MTNKILMVVALAAIGATLWAEPSPEDLEMAKRAARSIHLAWDQKGLNPDGVMGTVRVMESQTNTYFSIAAWQCGYCGIQDLGGHHIVLFSVWEPGSPHDYRARADLVPEDLHAKVLYVAPGVTPSRFGGEGTGAKTMAMLNWQIGSPVSVKLECAPDGTNRTAYTCYVKNGAAPWQKMAVISTLRITSGEPGFRGLYSFVEDFWRNYTSAKVSRRAEFSNFAIHKPGTDEWVTLDAAQFTGDGTPSNAIDAGKTPQGAFFLQTGGATKNEHAKLWSTIR